MATNEEINDEYDKQYNFIYDLVREHLPFIQAGFAGSFEDWQLSGFTIQRVGDGAYKLVIKSTRTDSDGNIDGRVSFSDTASLADSFALLEIGLSYDIFSWRIDQFWDGRAKTKKDKKKLKQLKLPGT